MSQIVNSIVAADFHHGAVPVERYRRELYDWFLPAVEQTCRSMHIDYMVIAGDYFDRKMEMTSPATQLAFRLLYDICVLCSQYGFPLYMINGTYSHDLRQLEIVESMTRIYRLQDGRPMVRVYFQPARVEVAPGYYVWMVPETYPEDTEAYMRSLIDRPAQAMHFHGRWDFAAFREEMLESEKPHRSAPVHETDRFRESIAGPITGGHIHTGDHNDKVFYTRSLSRWCHNEEAAKGFLVTSHRQDTREFRVWHVDNPLATRYVTIKVPPDGIEQCYQQARELRAQGVSVKLKASDGATYQLMRQAANIDGSIRVELDRQDTSIYSMVQSTHRDNPLLKAVENNDHVQVILDCDPIINGSETPLRYEDVAKLLGKGV